MNDDAKVFELAELVDRLVERDELFPGEEAEYALVEIPGGRLVRFKYVGRIYEA